jgi:outer membrane biosynthesis protein TonB
MQKSRFPRFIFAILALGTGIFSLRAAYLKLTVAGLSGATDIVVPTAFLLVCGLVCAVGGFMLWLRQAGTSRQGEASSRQPRFGRDAEPTGNGGSLLGPAVAVFLLGAFATLATDGMRLWPTAEQMLEELQGSGETEPAVDPGEVAHAPVAPSEPAAAPTVVPTAAPLPTERPAETQDVPSQPAPQTPTPEVASAPAHEPPQTTAPTPTHEELPTQPEGHRDAVVWLSVAPDGRTFLSASTDHTIKLWDFAERKLIKTLGSQKDMARSAIFLPDGERALTAGDDGEIVLRSVSDGAVLHVFSARDHGGVNKIAISADGRRMVSGHSSGSVILWDLETKQPLHALDAHGWSVAGVSMSPDGTTAVSGDIDGELKLWDVTSGRMLRSWLGHERGSYGIAYASDGRRLVTGSGDRTIKLWDLVKGKELRRFDGHSGTVYGLVLSADDKRILSASLDGTARLWNLETGDELAIYAVQTGSLHSVAFGPDSTVITGGGDRTIRIWPEMGGDPIALLAGAPQ